MSQKDDLNTLIRTCNATLPLSNQILLKPRFIRQNSDKLGQMMDRSYRKLSVIYPFIELTGGNKAPKMTVSLTDIVREADGIPVVERYVLDLNECAAVANLGVEAVSLIEMSDFQITNQRAVDMPPYAVSLLDKHAFVHIDTNCIEALQSALDRGDSVEWAAFRIGHAQGPLHQRASIHLCMHWFASNKLAHFHLATGEMVEAMQHYTQKHVNNSRRVCQISGGPGFNRIEGRILSKLIDHPLFNYYLAGKSPKETEAGD